MGNSRKVAIAQWHHHYARFQAWLPTQTADATAILAALDEWSQRRIQSKAVHIIITVMYADPDTPLPQGSYGTATDTAIRWFQRWWSHGSPDADPTVLTSSIGTPAVKPTAKAPGHPPATADEAHPAPDPWTVLWPLLAPSPVARQAWEAWQTLESLAQSLIADPTVDRTDLVQRWAARHCPDQARPIHACLRIQAALDQLPDGLRPSPTPT